MIDGIGTNTNQSMGRSTHTSEAQQEKDQFLKLLTYQLKSQNPTDPYDTDQFSSQLAQFSELETMTEIRDLIQNQNDNFTTLGQVFTNSALPGMIGMNAKIDSDEFTYDGQTAVKLGYDLPSSCSEATLTINDSAGVAVRTIKLSELDLTSGEHNIMWDGTNDNGNTLAGDDYTFEVSAFKNSEKVSDINTFAYGKIDAVRFKTEGTVLVVGGIEIALNDVSDISN